MKIKHLKGSPSLMNTHYTVNDNSIYGDNNTLQSTLSERIPLYIPGVVNPL